MNTDTYDSQVLESKHAQALAVRLGAVKQQSRSRSSRNDVNTRNQTTFFGGGTCAVTLPPVNSDRVRKRKCQASVNSICHLGVNFPLDENPLLLGKKYIPAFAVWLAKTLLIQTLLFLRQDSWQGNCDLKVLSFLKIFLCFKFFF